jgi:hypothetical protein
MKNFDKFVKYFVKQCGGNNSKVKYILSDELNKNMGNDNFIKECIRYILNKNIDPEMANLYIYYVISIYINNIDLYDFNVIKKHYGDNINEYIYNFQFLLFNKIKNIVCEKKTIYIETDEITERINNQIMIIGCGHHNIINLNLFKNNDENVYEYYDNHRHNNLFCVDIKLCIFPDLVVDISNSDLINVNKVQGLKKKFKIIILEGFLMEYEKIRENIDFFLEDGGLVLSAGGNAVELEEYTIENLEMFEYKVLNCKNDNDSYPLGYLLEKYFGLNGTKNILQKMFDGKVNIY